MFRRCRCVKQSPDTNSVVCSIALNIKSGKPQLSSFKLLLSSQESWAVTSVTVLSYWAVTSETSVFLRFAFKNANLRNTGDYISHNTCYFETALFVVNQTLCYLDVMTKLIRYTLCSWVTASWLTVSVFTVATEVMLAIQLYLHDLLMAKIKTVWLSISLPL